MSPQILDIRSNHEQINTTELITYDLLAVHKLDGKLAILRSFEVIAVTGASTLCTLHSSTRISRALEHRACNVVQ